MATLYSQSNQTSYGNYNWNSAVDWYADPMTITTTGTPTQITLYNNGNVGSPTWKFVIRASNTLASTAYTDIVTGYTPGTGANAITLTGGSQLTSGNTYYILSGRETDTSNYSQWQADYGVGTLNIYRSTAADSDPTTVWDALTLGKKILLEGTLPTPAVTRSPSGGAAYLSPMFYSEYFDPLLKIWKLKPYVMYASHPELKEQRELEIDKEFSKYRRRIRFAFFPEIVCQTFAFTS